MSTHIESGGLASRLTIAGSFFDAFYRRFERSPSSWLSIT